VETTSDPARASVLVVDDQSELAQMLAAMIKRDGHEVRVATSGLAAVAAVEQRVPDLVLTDLGMPGMSGLDLADALHERWPKLPVALVTGWGPTVDPARTRQSEIVQVLGKPFRMAEVRSLLARILDGSCDQAS
jgi:two-component system NtrC family response regulator/two-component system nitrogen regulation response regulator GlnG